MTSNLLSIALVGLMLCSASFGPGTNPTHGRADSAGIMSARKVTGTELEIDYDRSSLVAKLKKAGLLRFLGDEHGVLAQDWSAEVVFDEGDLDGSRVAVDIQVAGLVIDSAEARELAGVDPDGPNEQQREEIRATMLSDEQLAAAQHPQIRFESTSMRLSGNELELSGSLTILGNTRAVRVEADLEKVGVAYIVRGSFEIKLRDFGIEPVSIGGVVKVSNDVEISFEIFAEPPDTL